MHFADPQWLFIGLVAVVLIVSWQWMPFAFLILLTALLRKNGIPEDKVQKVIIGSDMTPLLTGQVDAVAGWRTNTTALKVLGPDYIAMRMWDQGVQLYALPYYTTADFLGSKPEALAGFLRAAGRGWAYARANRDKAVELLLKELPNLVAADERAECAEQTAPSL